MAVTQPNEQPAAGNGGGAPRTPVVMPKRVFFWTFTYVVALLTLFVIFVTYSAFRSAVPTSFGEIPVGVVWFGALGAVVASLFGIYLHNQDWDPSYNYWYYSRPVFGAITGSIGSLFYLVLLNVGNSHTITVNRVTFYAVAFVLGFADKAFMQMLKGVTDVIIKPGNGTSQN